MLSFACNQRPATFGPQTCGPCTSRFYTYKMQAARSYVRSDPRSCRVRRNNPIQPRHPPRLQITLNTVFMLHTQPFLSHFPFTNSFPFTFLLSLAFGFSAVFACAPLPLVPQMPLPPQSLHLLLPLELADTTTAAFFALAPPLIGQRSIARAIDNNLRPALDRAGVLRGFLAAEECSARAVARPDLGPYHALRALSLWPSRYVPLQHSLFACRQPRAISVIRHPLWHVLQLSVQSVRCFTLANAPVSAFFFARLKRRQLSTERHGEAGRPRSRANTGMASVHSVDFIFHTLRHSPAIF